VPHNKGKIEAAVAARGEAVRDLVQRGFSDAEIMALLQIGRSTVQRHVHELGLTGLRPRFRRLDADQPERIAA
jgi:DNA-binding NarL/FixJ family response regulator